MDVASLGIGVIFIAVMAVCVVVLESVFGLSYWSAMLTGLPLGWALVIGGVWFWARRRRP